jgi:hypothetical protein
LEKVPPLAGSQWLRPRTGALRLGLGQHATGGNFGVRVQSSSSSFSSLGFNGFDYENEDDDEDENA